MFFSSVFPARVQHHRIWAQVIKKHMRDLRTLPFDAIMNEFSVQIPNFTEMYSIDFESERRERGETKAIDWLFGTLLRTESEWPQALINVLRVHHLPLLNAMKNDFRSLHLESKGFLNVKLDCASLCTGKCCLTI